MNVFDLFLLRRREQPTEPDFALLARAFNRARARHRVRKRDGGDNSYGKDADRKTGGPRYLLLRPAPFDPCTFLLTGEPKYARLRGLSQERAQAGVGKDCEIDPADGENRQEMEKRY